MSEHQDHADDQDFRSGAVEDGQDDMIATQILPVWATTEPFGYEGDAADLQIVKGTLPDGVPDKAHARRDTIGPGSA